MQACPHICALRPVLVVSVHGIMEWGPNLRCPRDTLDVYTDARALKALAEYCGPVVLIQVPPLLQVLKHPI